MVEQERTYLCIDLKSFYASVECMERSLDPLTTNLVVADASRTTKTICLAVSPSLKSFGIPGRPRLFEVVKKVNEVNRQRLYKAKGQRFTGSSFNINELNDDLNLKLEYIIAPPRMAHYIEYSTNIYNIYLKYVAPEDIHVYSIDEVFMDLTNYLGPAKKTAHEFAMMLIQDVLLNTGITATAGIGNNMYLAKVAMDIVAKHLPADKDGVRIAELDEQSYREKLWNHRPLTDFWRVGNGYARKLEACGLYTMGDIALCSIGTMQDQYNDGLLYKLFGVNAELLIDHAWGYEPTTIKDIRSYKPSTNSLGSGQVLHHAYTFEKAKLVVKEMADNLALKLVEKHLVTNQLVLMVGYDISNLDEEHIGNYKGPIVMDGYGRKMPGHSQGTTHLDLLTSSSSLIVKAAEKLFERIANPSLSIRRINITAVNVISEKFAKNQTVIKQTSLFDDPGAIDKQEHDIKSIDKDHKLQQAMLQIKERYGKNSILRGMNYEEDATTIDRNGQIGGHKA